jgi:hypothetical protein
MKETPLRAEFETELAYREAYFTYLCLTYPNMKDSYIGEVMQNQIKLLKEEQVPVWQRSDDETLQ